LVTNAALACAPPENVNPVSVLVIVFTPSESVNPKGTGPLAGKMNALGDDGVRGLSKMKSPDTKPAVVYTPVTSVKFPPV
jgi:hypothetical protein